MKITERLKALLTDTVLEKPARRIYGALGKRAGAGPLSDSHHNAPGGQADEETPTHAEARQVDANADYDAQTAAVMGAVLTPRSVCVDVGCHVGQILDEMHRFAPAGHHHGFEPLPDLAQALGERYADFPNVTIHNAALNDEPGMFSFQHVRSNPGYSGFRRRRYDRPDEEVVETQVTAVRLDDVLSRDTLIDLMKIDVEGAELQVLKGARDTLARSRPVIVFEHGLGAADCYGTQPDQVYDFLNELNLQIFLMKDWLIGGRHLSRNEFIDQFETGANFYFMAAPSPRVEIGHR